MTRQSVVRSNLLLSSILLAFLGCQDGTESTTTALADPLVALALLMEAVPR